MRAGGDPDIGPELESQLARLEQLGNAEAELVHAESAPARRDYVVTEESLPLSETAHRRLTTNRKIHRELAKIRGLSLALLLLCPLFTLAYFGARAAGYGLWAVVPMLAAGITLGFAVSLLHTIDSRRDRLK